MVKPARERALGSGSWPRSCGRRAAPSAPGRSTASRCRGAGTRASARRSGPGSSVMPGQVDRPGAPAGTRHLGRGPDGGDLVAGDDARPSPRAPARRSRRTRAPGAATTWPRRLRRPVPAAGWASAAVDPSRRRDEGAAATPSAEAPTERPQPPHRPPWIRGVCAPPPLRSTAARGTRGRGRCILDDARPGPRRPRGEMREWLNRRDWKSRVGVTPLPRVRIPLSPPPQQAGAEAGDARRANGSRNW